MADTGGRSAIVPVSTGTAGTIEYAGGDTGGSGFASAGASAQNIRSTADVSATGGAVASGGSTVGGAGPLLQTCPKYAPSPGSACGVSDVCTYPDSACSNRPNTTAKCTELRWVVDVPMGCAQDLPKSNCAIDGTWKFSVTGDGGSIRGVPYSFSFAFLHDATGQYYVSRVETQKFSAFEFSPADCKVKAHYDYDTIIPPPNGSTCGAVSTDCDLEIVLSNGANKGTLTCTGHPNTCVGVYGGNAALDVKAQPSTQ